MREFTKDDAMRLISKMRINYGKKFADQWVGVDVEELKQAMVEAYQGLSMEDFARGYARMLQEQWPPTIPEFRSWCEPKTDDWLGSHEAWAIAEKSIGFDGQELTVIWTEQMAQAFSRCEELIKTGDKYQRAEAKKIFCDAYDRLVSQAKDQGLKPIYVTSLGTDKDQAIAAIKQAEVAGFLTTEQTALQLEHKQTQAEIDADAERYKTIAQKAIAELREKLKIQAPVSKMVDEIKEVQPWELKPDTDYWPDPFDQKEQYIEMHKADNKKVPLAVGGAA